jgi:hypothetical protein
VSSAERSADHAEVRRLGVNDPLIF